MTPRPKRLGERTERFSEVLNGKRPCADDRFLNDVLGTPAEKSDEPPPASPSPTHREKGQSLPAGPTTSPEPAVVSILRRTLTGAPVRNDLTGSRNSLDNGKEGTL